MVGGVRFDLTQPLGDGFTDRSDSPTSAPSQIKWRKDWDLNPGTSITRRRFSKPIH